MELHVDCKHAMGEMPWGDKHKETQAHETAQ